MLTEEQRSKRQFGLGASDSAIIMGYSSYKTPYELYLEKLGIVTDDNHDEETEQQYWGNALEPLIIKRFSEKNSLDVSFPDTIYHPNYNYIFANLDGWIASERAVVEAKCANSFQRKAWDSSAVDGIPLNYLIQIAKQVAVTDASKGYCAVLIGGSEYLQFVYERDHALEELIIKSDIEFWRCVQERIEPEAINTNDCRLKYKQISPDKVVQSTFKSQQYLYELILVKEQIKKASETEEQLKMHIMNYLRDAEYLVGQNGEIIATWKATKKGNRVLNIK